MHPTVERLGRERHEDRRERWPRDRRPPRRQAPRTQRPQHRAGGIANQCTDPLPQPRLDTIRTGDETRSHNSKRVRPADQRSLDRSTRAAGFVPVAPSAPRSERAGQTRGRASRSPAAPSPTPRPPRPARHAMRADGLPPARVARGKQQTSDGRPIRLHFLSRTIRRGHPCPPRFSVTSWKDPTRQSTAQRLTA